MAEDALRQDFEPAEFVFKFAENEPEAEGPGGNLRPSLIFNNELLGALPGEGNGQNLVTLEACGVNQPHHHPRGAPPPPKHALHPLGTNTRTTLEAHRPQYLL